MPVFRIHSVSSVYRITTDIFCSMCSINTDNPFRVFSYSKRFNSHEQAQDPPHFCTNDDCCSRTVCTASAPTIPHCGGCSDQPSRRIVGRAGQANLPL